MEENWNRKNFGNLLGIGFFDEVNLKQIQCVVYFQSFNLWVSTPEMS